MSETSPQTLSGAFKLGFILFGLFVVCAIGTFLLLGALGSEGAGQILIAALIGPIIGSGLFALWWRLSTQSASNKDT